MNTGKKRRINRYGVPRQANKTFHWGNLLMCGVLAFFEVATNRIGVLFMGELASRFVAPAELPTFRNVVDIAAWVLGAIPIVFLYNTWFTYVSGHYERKQDVHTEKLKDHDKGYVPDDGLMATLIQIAAVGIPLIITAYGVSMDWLGVYRFCGAPNIFILHNDQDKLVFWLIVSGAAFIALLSSFGLPYLYNKAWDMKDEAQIQERRHTVDLQNQTPVPERPGLLARIGSVGNGKQIASPKGKQPTTTI